MTAKFPWIIPGMPYITAAYGLPIPRPGEIWRVYLPWERACWTDHLVVTSSPSAVGTRIIAGQDGPATNTEMIVVRLADFFAEVEQGFRRVFLARFAEGTPVERLRRDRYMPLGRVIEWRAPAFWGLPDQASLIDYLAFRNAIGCSLPDDLILVETQDGKRIYEYVSLLRAVEQPCQTAG